MYDVLHFRSTLYLLVALGFTGFMLATPSPLMWIVSMMLLGTNAWLVQTGRFRPLPRWFANLLTLIAAVYTTITIYAEARPIFPIGYFLVVLQLIKAYEQRANRDYAQLLVLSLLLMVAAAISTAGLLFGVTFILYLFLSPYACLLFHLKVESDHAKRMIGIEERQPDPMTLRQDQRFLSRSMTRVTAVVGAVSAGMAVLVFIFFPRMPGANLLTFQFRPGTASTGLSADMNMTSVTKVQQNTEDIAALRVTHNGDLVTSGELYLRTLVYDVYDGNPLSATAWRWSLSPPGGRGPRSAQRTPDQDVVLDGASAVEQGDVWVQEFMPLKPTGIAFLPAMPGVSRITVDRPLGIGYSAVNGMITTDSELNRPLRYRVTSTNVQREVPRLQPTGASPSVSSDDDDTTDTTPGTVIARPPRSIIAPQIESYARRADVSGTAPDGRPLVELLGAPGAPPTAVVEQVARNIEQHLQTQFTYTLDLGDGNRTRDDAGGDDDPITRFLYRTRSGWCEHFATSMTLMCQSLGMQSRLVSGYKCDEYNAMGGYFIVRQSHAHAWVEVLVRDGDRNVWRTFDPTGGRDANGAKNDASAWTRVAHFFDYLEHVWANSVVAYDAGAQTGLIDRVENRLLDASAQANSTMRDTNSWMSTLSRWLSESRYSISASIIVGLVSLMIAIALGLIGWYLAQRVRLKRRARRIGVDVLGGSESRRLARQLGFYDDLVRVLERRDIVRAPHLTPLEFGESLSFLPREAYETIVRLTRIFYRIRFGNTELTLGRRRALERMVERLRDALNPRPLG